MARAEQAPGWEVPESGDFHNTIKEAVEAWPPFAHPPIQRTSPSDRPVEGRDDGRNRTYSPDGRIAFGPYEKCWGLHVGAKYTLFLAYDTAQDRSEFLVHRFDTAGRLRARATFYQRKDRDIAKQWLSETPNCWSTLERSSSAEQVTRRLSGEEEGNLLAVVTAITSAPTETTKDAVNDLMRISPGEWEQIRRYKAMRQQKKKLRTRSVQTLRDIHPDYL